MTSLGVYNSEYGNMNMSQWFGKVIIKRNNVHSKLNTILRRIDEMI